MDSREIKKQSVMEPLQKLKDKDQRSVHLRYLRARAAAKGNPGSSEHQDRLDEAQADWQRGLWRIIVRNARRRVVELTAEAAARRAGTHNDKEQPLADHAEVRSARPQTSEEGR